MYLSSCCLRAEKRHITCKVPRVLSFPRETLGPDVAPVTTTSLNLQYRENVSLRDNATTTWYLFIIDEMVDGQNARLAHGRVVNRRH